ncbi:MAG: hypothetical protein MZV65_20430 [Chromatiales bacterium]|nr:hypothetical protein [Chromatiales bacterium]
MERRQNHPAVLRSSRYGGGECPGRRVSIDRANTSINYVRYGGVNLTQIAVAFSGTNPEASIWYMVNPPAGTANVTISLGGNEEVIAGAISLFGVNTTTPFDVAAATSTGNGNAASVTITPVTSGAWVFDVMAVNNGKDVTPTAAGQTQHQNPRSTTG